jgi:hypothetical protein
MREEMGEEIGEGPEGEEEESEEDRREGEEVFERVCWVGGKGVGGHARMGIDGTFMALRRAVCYRGCVFSNLLVSPKSHNAIARKQV